MPTLPGLPQGREPSEPDPEKIKAAAVRAVDGGFLIEAGWIGLRAAWIPDNAPAIQVEEMRNAFFAGAQHVFETTFVFLDPGDEPTPQDEARLGKISEELGAFYAAFVEKRLKRPTTAMAMGVMGATTEEIIAAGEIDLALKNFAARTGKLSARDIAMLLTTPLYKLPTDQTEDVARGVIEAMRTGLDALEEQVAKRHPPRPKEHF